MTDEKDRTDEVLHAIGSVKTEVLDAIGSAKAYHAELIQNNRSMEVINIDKVVNDVSEIRRAVNWLKSQWSKFSRNEPPSA
jgi:hypothetical protein